MLFTGKATTAGTSKVIAFEAALFRTHPEFAKGRFVAHVLGPGALLVVPEHQVEQGEDVEDDPILEAYLAFLEQDMQQHPERITPITPAMMQTADELVGHLPADPDEELGSGVTLP